MGKGKGDRRACRSAAWGWKGFSHKENFLNSKKFCTLFYPPRRKDCGDTAFLWFFLFS